jgi:hypothetical protein
MKTYKVTVDDDGTKFWYRAGKWHREDGPAIEWANGDKQWYRNGKCHREDGPAVEWADGTRFWYQDDDLHREDGPAIEWANGRKEWYLDGNALTKAEFMAHKKSRDGKVVTIDGKQYKLTEVK